MFSSIFMEPKRAEMRSRDQKHTLKCPPGLGTTLICHFGGLKHDKIPPLDPKHVLLYLLGSQTTQKCLLKSQNID